MEAVEKLMVALVEGWVYKGGGGFERPRPVQVVDGIGMVLKDMEGIACMVVVGVEEGWKVVQNG